jgi:hypothetical protein
VSSNKAGASSAGIDRLAVSSPRARLLLAGVCVLLSPTVAASCAYASQQANDLFDYRGYYEEFQHNRGTPCKEGAVATIYSPSRTKIGTAPLVISKNESVKGPDGRPLNTDDLPSGMTRVPRNCGYLFEFTSIPAEEGNYTINITRDSVFLEKIEGSQSYLEGSSVDTPMP